MSETNTDVLMVEEISREYILNTFHLSFYVGDAELSFSHRCSAVPFSSVLDLDVLFSSVIQMYKEIVFELEGSK